MSGDKRWRAEQGNNSRVIPLWGRKGQQAEPAVDIIGRGVIPMTRQWSGVGRTGTRAFPKVAEREGSMACANEMNENTSNVRDREHGRLR